jgi:hypothetical protein
MVLDRAEFVSAVEEAFGITIPDVEAASFQSARELVDLICAALAGPGAGARTAFLELRDALRQRIDPGPGRRLRPRTELAELLPWSYRPRLWEQLGEDLGVGLPALRRPREVAILGIWVCGTIGFLVGMMNESWTLGIVATLLAGLTAYLATRPLAREFALGEGHTIGDLAQRLFALRCAAGRDPTDPEPTVTRQEVEARLAEGLLLRLREQDGPEGEGPPIDMDAPYFSSASRRTSPPYSSHASDGES